MSARSCLNRWRRRLAQALLFRMVHGEHGRPHTRIAPSTCITGEAHLVLGDHVFIGQFNMIDAHGGLTIEEGVQITSFVSIATHSSHRSIRLLGRQYVHQPEPIPGYIKAPVHIGAYSYIGPHSLIEAGAHIGKGCVVSAYSRVRGQVPDFAIVAGQPARVIGDVRAKDEALLAAHPELRAHYEAWAAA